MAKATGPPNGALRRLLAKPTKHATHAVLGQGNPLRQSALGAVGRAPAGTTGPVAYSVSAILWDSAGLWTAGESAASPKGDGIISILGFSDTEYGAGRMADDPVRMRPQPSHGLLQCASPNQYQVRVML